MARPTKLTPEVTKRLCDAIRAGNHFEVACTYAGIDYTTMRKWMLAGEKAKTGALFEFFEAVRKAESECEIKVVALWQTQIPANWQAARDFLERRYPHRWGRREKSNVEIGGEVKIKHDSAEQNVFVSIDQYTAIFADMARSAAESDCEGDAIRQSVDTTQTDTATNQIPTP